MKTSEIQKQLNTLSKMNNLQGELFINVKTNAKDYKELEEVTNLILSKLEGTENLKKNENCFYNKTLKIYIHFEKCEN